MIRFLFAALLFISSVAHARISVVDGLGRTVAVPEAVSRIVSLSPHATELLFSAGLGERLVGVVSHSDYPPKARSIARVGDGFRIDLERVLSLQPDLIVAWPSGNPDAAIDFLRRQQIPVFLTEPTSIDTIAAEVEALARLGGTEEEAVPAVRVFRDRIEALRARKHPGRSLRAFYQVWDSPLMTLNANHIASRVMRLCGAEPIFADLPKMAGSVAMEAVLEADPEVILIPKSNERWKEAWLKWPALSAVRRRAILMVEADLLVRPTLRVAEGAEQLCTALEQVADE